MGDNKVYSIMGLVVFLDCGYGVVVSIMGVCEIVMMIIVFIVVLFYLVVSVLLVCVFGCDELIGLFIWLWLVLFVMLLYGGYYVMVVMCIDGGLDMYFFVVLLLVGLGMVWLILLVGVCGWMLVLGVVVFLLVVVLLLVYYGYGYELSKVLGWCLVSYVWLVLLVYVMLSIVVLLVIMLWL